MSSPTRAQILEAIQHAIPRQQSVVHFAETARTDAVAVLDALVALERELRPDYIDAGRVVNDLHAAAIRHGLTLAALGHLTAIPPERLLQIAEGAHPSGSERRALAACLPDWDGAR